MSCIIEFHILQADRTLPSDSNSPLRRRSSSPLPFPIHTPLQFHHHPTQPQLHSNLPHSSQERGNNHSRGIRLIRIRHRGHEQAAPEPIHERILPPFLLILLPRLHAEQPPPGRIVVGFVPVGAAVRVLVRGRFAVLRALRGCGRGGGGG